MALDKTHLLMMATIQQAAVQENLELGQALAVKDARIAELEAQLEALAPTQARVKQAPHADESG